MLFRTLYHSLNPLAKNHSPPTHSHSTTWCLFPLKFLKNRSSSGILLHVVLLLQCHWTDKWGTMWSPGSGDMIKVSLQPPPVTEVPMIKQLPPPPPTRCMWLPLCRPVTHPSATTLSCTGIRVPWNNGSHSRASTMN